MIRLFEIFLCLFLFTLVTMAQSDDKTQQSNTTNSSPMQQDQDVTKYRADIEKMNQKFDKAMLDGDYSTLNSFWVDDGIALPSYQPILNGKEAITEMNKKEIAEGVKYHTFVTKPSQVFGNGNLICEIGTYQVTFTPANTTNPIDDHGKYLNLWEKQSDGSLKIKVQTWNTDLPPQGMMAGAREKEDSTETK